jgi:AcrR family transcriptional regulator
VIQIAARVSFVTATAPAHVVEFLEDSDPTTVRILVAAHDEFTEHGVRATTMNRVAERAELGVATVYRRFPQKAQLVRAVVLREAALTTIAVDTAMRPEDSVEEQCAAGFSAFARALEERPMLVRLLRGETDRDGGLIAAGDLADRIIAMVRDYLAGWIRDLQALGRFLSIEPEVVAEIEARLALSLVIVPEGQIPIHDNAGARAFAARYLVPMLGPE